jgi:hypothetical protein
MDAEGSPGDRADPIRKFAERLRCLQAARQR